MKTRIEQIKSQTMLKKLFEAGLPIYFDGLKYEKTDLPCNETRGGYKYVCSETFGFIKLNESPSNYYYDPDDLKLKSEFATSLESKNPLDVQVGGGHYKDLKIQPVEYISANNMGFLEGNIIKYVTRHKNKNKAEDIKKVIHYAQLILKLEYGLEE